MRCPLFLCVALLCFAPIAIADLSREPDQIVRVDRDANGGTYVRALKTAALPDRVTL